VSFEGSNPSPATQCVRGPLTSGNVLGGPLLIPGGGIENGPVLAVIRFWGRRPVTCTNAFTGLGGFDVRRECAGKL
jgi:hypothetical protein